MSNERTLPESQGAGGSRPGRGEAQLRAAGRQMQGRQLKAQWQRRPRGPGRGAPPRAGLCAGAGARASITALPGLGRGAGKAARTAEQRPSATKGAPLRTGSLRGWVPEGDRQGRRRRRPRKAERGGAFGAVRFRSFQRSFVNLSVFIWASGPLPQAPNEGGRRCRLDRSSQLVSGENFKHHVWATSRI